MKKTSYARRNALLPRRTQLFGAAVLLIAAGVVLTRAFFPGALLTLAAPLWNAGSALSRAVGDVTAAFTGPVALKRDLEAQVAQNAALESENTTLVAEVADLTRLLGSRAEAPPSVLAAVTTRPPESPYDMLIIDQGSRAGVAVGALVTGPGGVPVGRVASVTASYARVLLFSASGTNTDAHVGDARTPITLIGEGAGAFTAVAPKAAPIAHGDAVFVENAAFGTIARIDSDPSASSEELRITPFVNPFSLTWVLISRT